MPTISYYTFPVSNVEITSNLVNTQRPAHLTSLTRLGLVERTDGLALTLLRLHHIAQTPALLVVGAFELTAGITTPDMIIQTV